MKKIAYKLPIIFIAFLNAGIIFIQYRIISYDLNIDNKSPKVKSASIDPSDNLVIPLEPNDLMTLPKKSESYRKENIFAKNYILLDVDSAYPLAQNNSRASVSIASTTKIMTAIIALENYNLDDIVTVSSNAATQIGSDVMLMTNEKMSVKSLLYALLIQSGNDAAMALAEHYQDGGLNGFIKAIIPIIIVASVITVPKISPNANS